MSEPSLVQLTALCRAALPDRRDLEVDAVESLGGYQHELWALTVRFAGRSRLIWTPPEREDLVLRLYRSPLTWWSTADERKPARELALAPLLAAAGLPTPRVYAGGVDQAGGLGRFLLMSRAPGFPWFSPGVDVRAILTPLIEPHAHQLARLHAIAVDAAAEGALPRVSVTDAIDRYHVWAEEAGAAEVAGMAARLREIAAGRAELPPALIHGSPDFGNILIGDDGRIAAWLDWEDSALADPRWDVAAVVAYLRVFMLADLGQRFIACYEAASGRKIEDMTLWLALIALRGWALTSWLAAEKERGRAPAFPGLDHWLFSLPRYAGAGRLALQRVEGWARLQQRPPL